MSGGDAVKISTETETWVTVRYGSDSQRFESARVRQCRQLWNGACLGLHLHTTAGCEDRGRTELLGTLVERDGEWSLIPPVDEQLDREARAMVHEFEIAHDYRPWDALAENVRETWRKAARAAREMRADG